MSDTSCGWSDWLENRKVGSKSYYNTSFWYRTLVWITMNTRIFIPYVIYCTATVNYSYNTIQYFWLNFLLLVFSTLPKDGVGILDSPLMLHCAVYDSSLQKVVPVKWEKDSGGLGVGVHQMANGSLFFAHLQEEDLGGYICSAKKGSNQIRNVIRVNKACMYLCMNSVTSSSSDCAVKYDLLSISSAIRPHKAFM